MYKAAIKNISFSSETEAVLTYDIFSEKHNRIETNQISLTKKESKTINKIIKSYHREINDAMTEAYRGTPEEKEAIRRGQHAAHLLGLGMACISQIDKEYK